MTIKAIHTHTNLIARDWRKLASFYIDAFGCVPVPPERDLTGEAIDRGTGVPGAHITGIHLRLPGHGESGPTIENFSYNRLSEEGQRRVNRPGWSHLAFRVDNVPEAVKAVQALGGELVGEVVTTMVGLDKSITWCYLTDPEGNIFELQTAIH